LWLSESEYVQTTLVKVNYSDLLGTILWFNSYNVWKCHRVSFFFTVHRNISKIHDFRVCIIWKLNIFAILKKTKFHTFWFFPHSWLITVFVTRVTRRVPFVDQQLFTLPEHMSLSPVVSGVRVTWPLVLCVMFCRSLFVLLSFFSGHCVVSPSPIDEFD